MRSGTLPQFFFESTKLQILANKKSADFFSATPFRHAVFDHFLPEKIADQLYREFEAANPARWQMWGPGKTQHTGIPEVEKTGTSIEENFSPLTRFMLLQFNSQTFLKFLETLTGHSGLISDPHYNGCGLHSTGRGGRLMVHTDSNRYPIKSRHIHQILNCIYFVNRGWKESYGGAFELWDTEGKACVKKVAPIFNRFLVFETGTNSFHGHPEPLACPAGRRRNSLAAYFYQIDRPTHARYTGLQKNVQWLPQTPYERRRIRRDRIVDFLNGFVPPVYFDAVDWLKNRIDRLRRSENR